MEKISDFDNIKIEKVKKIKKRNFSIDEIYKNKEEEASKLIIIRLNEKIIDLEKNNKDIQRKNKILENEKQFLVEEFENTSQIISNEKNLIEEIKKMKMLSSQINDFYIIKEKYENDIANLKKKIIMKDEIYEEIFLQNRELKKYIKELENDLESEISNNEKNLKLLEIEREISLKKSRKLKDLSKSKIIENEIESISFQKNIENNLENDSNNQSSTSLEFENFISTPQKTEDNLKKIKLDNLQLKENFKEMSVNLNCLKLEKDLLSKDLKEKIKEMNEVKNENNDFKREIEELKTLNKLSEEKLTESQNNCNNIEANLNRKINSEIQRNEGKNEPSEENELNVSKSSNIKEFYYFYY